MSSSLPPHCLHHVRLPCPSLSSRVSSNSCPLNQWCHPTISSFVIPFFSCPQSSSASGSFPMKRFLHQLFVSGDQSIGASASASFLPMNIQNSFRTEYLNSFRTDWFDLGVQETLKSLHQHHSLKASVLQDSVFFMVQLSHPSMTTGKTIALTIWTFVVKWCLCYLVRV